jgi:beta-galactosidase
MVYSSASKWAFEFHAPLASERREGDPKSYERIFDAFHSGIIESNRQAVIVQDVHLVEHDPLLFAKTNPVLLAPAFYIATDAQLNWLSAYVQGGGHLVLGIRSAYADEEARARVDVAPPGLAASAKVHYDEFSNLSHDLAARSVSGMEISADAAGTEWIDGLISDGAEILAEYDHPEFGRFPAITTTTSGSGRITYVGTVPNPVLSRDIARWLVPEPLGAAWLADPEGRVLVQSGTTPNGQIWFISNWSSGDAGVTVPFNCFDLESRETLIAGSVMLLHRRDVRILGRL